MTTVRRPPQPEIYPAVRLAGLCGAVSAVLIFTAPSLSGATAATAWLTAFVLLLPFFAGVATLARTAGGPAAWLSPAIPAATAVLVSVHLVNVGIEHTANSLSKGSPVHEPLHEIGGALFIIGMLPFGAALVVAAVVGLAGRALPRWLAAAALVIGVVSLVNGTMIGSEMAWGFLLSTVWVFAAGVTLTVRGSTMAAEKEPVTAAA